MTHEQRIAEIREDLEIAIEVLSYGLLSNIPMDRTVLALKNFNTLAAECLRLRETSVEPIDFCFCPRCGVQMNPKVDTSGINVDELLKDKGRLDWLETHSGTILWSNLPSKNLGCFTEINITGRDQMRGGLFRQALDAAKEAK